LSFEFVSDFDIRISDLVAALPRCAPSFLRGENIFVKILFFVINLSNIRYNTTACRTDPSRHHDGGKIQKSLKRRKTAP
jgi:hypothetical protein